MTEQIAGDHDKGGALLDRQIDDIGEGAPRGAADQLGKGRILLRQTVKRAVEMDVRGVNEGERTGHGCPD